MSNININPNDNPTRRQSSLGGNVRFRDAGNVEENYGIFLAYVTHVYYQEGTLDFDARDTIENLVDVGLGKGLGQAPIPVETFGTNSDGKVYGQYRPINVGDKVAIAYLNGSRRTPIVIGVYPKNSSSYELVSPVPFNMKNESDNEAEVTTLSDKKIYPSQQVFYQSGKGDIFRSLGGHSFMTLNEDQMDFTKDLDYAYDAISAFYDNNGEQLNPQEDKAQAWLLVHEDNPDSNSADGHRTRFYVAKDGEVQLVFTNSNNPGVLILQGSLDKGLTIKKQYDTSVIDTDSSNEYVTLNIGGDSGFSLDVHNVSGTNLTRSVKNSTNFAVKSDDVYVNNVSLTDLIGENADDIQQIIDNNQKYNQEYFDKLDKSTKEAGQIARNAARDAHEAGAHAHDAGEQAKATSKDIKDRIMYYMNISPEEDVYVPNKYLIIHTDTFIEDATIKQGMIDDLAVGTAQIAYEAVGTAEIEDLAVSSGKIDNLAVTDEKVGHLTFDHMIGEQIDANTIDVVNLHGDNITAGTITADKILINGLGDLSHHLGDITDGHIQSGDNGVIIDDLPADDPDQWTPAKKALLKQQIGILEAEANATIQYGENVGIKSDTIENAKDNLINGTASLLSNMTTTEKFSNSKIQTWISDLKNAVEDFRNEANNTLIKKVGTTESGNNIYQGPEEPDVSKVHLGDIWFKEYEKDGKKTYEQLVYGNDGWYSPSDYNITQIQEQLDKLPTPYYQADEPQGDIKKDDTWYKTSTDSNGNINYTAYKYDGHDWKPMLDNNANKNTSGTSAPANPHDGDQWFDETNKQLKQWKGNDWVVIPTQGPQGIPGTDGSDGKTYYTWIKYAKDENGASMSDNPEGMDYIGLAYNKDSADESSIATDYTWSLFKGAKGDQGVPGEDGKDGKPSYTWIKYADSPTSGMSDSPDGKQYMGIVTNKDTATESSDYSDYTWSLINDNSKKRNFVDTPTTPYDIGDTWTQSGATYYCTTPRKSGAFDKSDWTMQQLTITSLSDDVKNGINQANNLQIGGRNYLLDSDFYLTSANASHNNMNLSTSIQELAGKTVTFSLDVDVKNVKTVKDGNSNTRALFELKLAKTDGSFDYIGVAWENFNVGDSYSGRLINTTTIPNNDYKDTTSILEGVYTQGFTADSIKVGRPKLEFGNKATDYTPAPEDMVNKQTAYKGVTLNDSGLTATAGSTQVALNSSDGFLIKKGSSTLFNADTSGNLTMQGDITAGNISGVNFTGNNLTLAGSLKTTGSLSSGNGKVTLSNTGLNIKGAGLTIGDSSGKTTTMISDDGTFTANKAILSGSLTSNSVAITGGTISMNGGNFSVDSSGNMIAQNATIAGSIGSNLINSNFENIKQDWKGFMPWWWDDGNISIGNGSIKLDAQAKQSLRTDSELWGDTQWINEELTPSYLKLVSYSQDPALATEVTNLISNDSKDWQQGKVTAQTGMPPTYLDDKNRIVLKEGILIPVTSNSQYRVIISAPYQISIQEFDSNKKFLRGSGWISGTKDYITVDKSAFITVVLSPIKDESVTPSDMDNITLQFYDWNDYNQDQNMNGRMYLDATQLSFTTNNGNGHFKVDSTGSLEATGGAYFLGGVKADSLLVNGLLNNKNNEIIDFPTDADGSEQRIQLYKSMLFQNTAERPFIGSANGGYLQFGGDVEFVNFNYGNIGMDTKRYFYVDQANGKRSLLMDSDKATFSGEVSASKLTNRSQESLKRDIEDIDCKELVRNLYNYKVNSWNYKTESKTVKKHLGGVISDKDNYRVPDVFLDDDGTAINQSNLINALVAAVQEQASQISELYVRLTKLELGEVKDDE